MIVLESTESHLSPCSSNEDGCPFIVKGVDQLLLIFMICFKELDEVKEIKELENWYSIAALLRKVTPHMFDRTGKNEWADEMEKAFEDVELGVEIIFSVCDDEQESKYDNEYINKLGYKLGYEYSYKKQCEKGTNMRCVQGQISRCLMLLASLEVLTIPWA